MKYFSLIFLFLSFSICSFSQLSSIDSLNSLIKQSSIEEFYQLSDIKFYSLIDFIDNPKAFVGRAHDGLKFAVRTQPDKWISWNIELSMFDEDDFLKIEKINLNKNDSSYILIKWKHRNHWAYGSHEEEGVQIWDIQNAIKILDAGTHYYHEERGGKDASGAKPTILEYSCKQSVFVKDGFLFIQKGNQNISTRSKEMSEDEYNCDFLPSGEYTFDKMKWVKIR